MPEVDKLVGVTDVTTKEPIRIGDASLNAARVAVVGGSAAGTEYTEGDTDTSPTGPVVMWEGASGSIKSTNDTDRLPVAAVIVNGRVSVDGVLYDVKQAGINATASGDTTVVAIVASRKIRVLGLTFSCSAAVSVAWKSAATTLVQAMSFAANGGMEVDRGGYGYWTQTAVGEALIINLSDAVNVRGSVTYCEVP
jgi:hypothetical protein